MSIGTELLLGTILDTNAQYLAQRLAVLGIDCFYISQVGDNLERLVQTFRRAWERSELVVATGGLGPTQDDLTREAISEMLHEPMTADPGAEKMLRRFFASRGSPMPETNIKQAMLIPSSSALLNPVGTAPGWWVEQGSGKVKHIIVAMPGVPFEMKRMWEQEAEPRLRVFTGDILVSRTLKVLGLGESRVEEIVADLMHSSNPTLAPYAKQDGIHLRITAKTHTESEARAKILELETEVRARLGEAVYGADDDTPQHVVSKLLAEQNLSIAIIEVGDGALGSISPLLGSVALGSFGANDLEALAHIVGDKKATTLDDSGMQTAEVTGADLVVAASCIMRPREGDKATVTAVAQIALFSKSACITRTELTWRTTNSEVGRLVGLAALNTLRVHLLHTRKGEVVA